MAKSIKELLNMIENEHIVNQNLENIVGERFGNYSKYIIQDRALPDCRDGLKPVQRRILYSMNNLGMYSTKPYKKSARIVGDVIGKYHPHGDTSIYDAMVRMSQNWKMRYLLIDMHGNNGSIDGDSAAAMRYTEARMSKFSELLLRDIDKQTVDFIPNFDDEEYEPSVLPARFPALLVNGAKGIASGYATEIPPHNLHEVIHATIHRIKNPHCELSELLEFIKGPDFPTGATVQGLEGIQDAYATGRGKIHIKSNVEIIDNRIIIHEIPYEVNKAKLVKTIEDIRIGKKVDGIQEVRDESDREGLRIAIDLKKNVDPDLIVTYLMKSTELTKTYNYNIVAINNKKPETMSLPSILDAYILHQKDVITNRSNFDLKRALKRQHIVEGIIKMIDIVDLVIKTIRESKDKSDAKAKLMERFEFSEIQAEAIVTLQLYRLSNTDINDLQKEAAELAKKIKHLQTILNNESALEKVIVKELSTVLKDFPSERKTVIEEEVEKFVVNEEMLIQKECVKVVLTKEGYLKRTSLRSYNAVGDEGIGLKDTDGIVSILDSTTVSTILLFTNQGSFINIPVYKIPDHKWRDLGSHISTMFTLKPDEKIIKVVNINSFDPKQSIIIATKLGLIKRTSFNEFNVSRTFKHIKAIGLNKNDEVIGISNTIFGDEAICIVTEQGSIVKYDQNEIPLLGTTAKGLKGISLRPNDYIGSCTYIQKDSDLLVLTNRGTVKRIALDSIPLTSRLRKGTYIYKQIKTRPYLVRDIQNMTLHQYKNKEKMYIITDNKQLQTTVFECKITASGCGKQFLDKTDGEGLYLFIDNKYFTSVCDEEDTDNSEIIEVVEGQVSIEEMIPDEESIKSLNQPLETKLVADTKNTSNNEEDEEDTENSISIQQTLF